MRRALLVLGLLATLTSPVALGLHGDYIPLFGAFDHPAITYRVHRLPDPIDERLAEIAEMAFPAWESAAHVYGSSSGSAAHLLNLSIRPAPKGQPADIDVFLGPMGVIAGVGMPFGPVHPCWFIAPTRGCTGANGEEPYPATPAGPGWILHSEVHIPNLYAGSCSGGGLGGQCLGPPGFPSLHTGVDAISLGAFYSIAVHEVGHALGLAHPNTTAGSVMKFHLPGSGSGGPGTICFGQVELEGLAVAYGWLRNGSFEPAPSLAHSPTFSRLA